MGQKVNPIGFRIGVTRDWSSRWFVGENKLFIENLLEDQKIRKYLSKKLLNAGLAAIVIERSVGIVRVTVKVARPGVVIGRSGSGAEQVRHELEKISKSKIVLNVEEVKNSETIAPIVAAEIARQLERRMATKRVMNMAAEKAMDKGASGIKIVCKGRVGGAKIARGLKVFKGKVPLQMLRAPIDYASVTANLKDYGTVGIKVWIYKEGK